MALTDNRKTVHTLAKYLGTSVAMIEQYFGHLELTRVVHENAGKWRKVSGVTP